MKQLSKAQLIALDKISTKRFGYWIASYGPYVLKFKTAASLEKLGLVRIDDSRADGQRAVITEAGKAALEN